MDFYKEKQTFIIIDFSMDTAGKEIYKILTTETTNSNYFLPKCLDAKYFNLTQKHLLYPSEIVKGVEVFRPITNIENLERRMVFSYLNNRHNIKYICFMLDFGFTTEALMSAYDLVKNFTKTGDKMLILCKRSDITYQKVESRCFFGNNYLYIEYGTNGIDPSCFMKIVRDLPFYKDAITFDYFYNSSF